MPRKKYGGEPPLPTSEFAGRSGVVKAEKKASPRIDLAIWLEKINDEALRTEFGLLLERILEGVRLIERTSRQSIKPAQRKTQLLADKINEFHGEVVGFKGRLQEAESKDTAAVGEMKQYLDNLSKYVVSLL